MDYATIEGWCSQQKRERLQSLIKEVDAKIVVELGVYAGSSAIPMAACMRDLGNGGILHTIDPWLPEASCKGFDSDNPNYRWWKKLSHHWIKDKFERNLNKFNVRENVKVHVACGEDVKHLFDRESIDLFHLDGNHSELCSCQDVLSWAEKVRYGGYFVFDDTNWETTHAAQRLLLSQGYIVHEQYPTYAIFRRI